MNDRDSWQSLKQWSLRMLPPRFWQTYTWTLPVSPFAQVLFFDCECARTYLSVLILLTAGEQAPVDQHVRLNNYRMRKCLFADVSWGGRQPLVAWMNFLPGLGEKDHYKACVCINMILIICIELHWYAWVLHFVCSSTDLDRHSVQCPACLLSFFIWDHQTRTGTPRQARVVWGGRYI